MEVITQASFSSPLPPTEGSAEWTRFFFSGAWGSRNLLLSGSGSAVTDRRFVSPFSSHRDTHAGNNTGSADKAGPMTKGRESARKREEYKTAGDAGGVSVRACVRPSLKGA